MSTTQVCDLYRFAKIESQQKNNEASKDPAWNESNWWEWATEKLMEHVSGHVCWAQFEPATFGVLKKNPPLQQNLTKQYESFKSKSLSLTESDQFLEELNSLLLS